MAPAAFRVRGPPADRKNTRRAAETMPIFLVFAVGAAVAIALGLVGLGDDQMLAARKAHGPAVHRMAAAIERHVARHGALPCPAPPDRPVTAGDAGQGDCAAAGRVGVPPWRDLGLPLAAVRTDSGTLFTYGRAGGLHCDRPDPLDAPVRVRDARGDGVVTRTGAYVLVDHGPDRAGAWWPDGTHAPVPESLSGAQRENIDGDTVFAAAPRGSSDDTVVRTAATALCGPDPGDRGARAGAGGRVPVFRAESLDDLDRSRAPARPRSRGSGRPAPPRRRGPARSAPDAPAGAPAASACRWLPRPFPLAGRRLTAFLRFAADGTERPGFTVAVRAPDGTPSRDVCGRTGAGMAYRDLPGARTAVEVDATPDRPPTGIYDPAGRHVAILRRGVSHARDAGPRCRDAAPGPLAAPPAGCHDGVWPHLLADLYRRHALRVTVLAYNRADNPCGGAGRALVRAWLWPEGAGDCPACSDIRRRLRRPPLVSHCLPLTMARAAVGFTFAGGAAAPGRHVVIRDIAVGSFPLSGASP